MLMPLPFANPLFPVPRTSPLTPETQPQISKKAPVKFEAIGGQDDSGELALNELLKMAERDLPVQRRLVRPGDIIFRQSDDFTHLHLIHSGFFKLVGRFPDGRERIVQIGMKGDWLGFDGLACGFHDCDAIALETGQILTVPYKALLQAGAAHPRLLTAALAAACHALVDGRTLSMALCTLSAGARVAQFLRNWAESLRRRGLRFDSIKLYLSREEIGRHLGITLETVSRALAELARANLIQFDGPRRRDIRIPDIAALEDFIKRSVDANGVKEPPVDGKAFKGCGAEAAPKALASLLKTPGALLV